MKKLCITFLLFCFCSSIFAQKTQSNISQQNIAHPTIWNNGILSVNPNDGSLYFTQNNKTHLLISTPGSGEYFNISKTDGKIGFKYIDQNGKQTPSIIDPTTNKITYLYNSVRQAGQVSFADDGTIAFTIGNNLIIKSQNKTKKFDLGNYANLAPISHDGNFVAYNNLNDQMFIVILNTGKKIQISDNKKGYFNPAWSPDSKKLLYSSLAGGLKVYDLQTEKTYSLGEGYSPSWSNDSKQIIFYKKEIEQLKVVNTDLYLSNYSGSNIKKITSTSDQMEIDPSFNSDDSKIIYALLQSNKIVESNYSVNEFKINNPVATTIKFSSQEAPQLNSVAQTEDFDTLKIPYINQLYDTPDYFNGSAACGPTASMMVLAFYNILPEWNIHCSWPSGHNSPYGQYISDTYRFRQNSYGNQAKDPNGREAHGAYGFMWTGSNSPYSTMTNFYSNHGIPAKREDAPSYSFAEQQINSGFPYTICVGLTSAGHIIVAHGIATQSHTLIFNDPYGNKNSGYPNYSGKNVKYDWPGYNNGFQNLKTVYWAVSVNYTQKAVPDTLIDDLDFASGFYLNNKPPASMSSWKDLNTGFNDHMWFSFTTSDSVDNYYAVWTPNLPKAGFYNVSAYVPYSQAEAAKYIISSSNGIKQVTVNQKNYTDSWVSLGTYKFDLGKTGFVRLGDASSISGQAIIFDAVKWSYVDSTNITSVTESNIKNPNFELEQNYPNPFNPTTVIKYSLKFDSNVKIVVYNTIGKAVKELVDDSKSAGSYSQIFNGANLSSGVYFYTIEAISLDGENNFRSTKKMILLK